MRKGGNGSDAKLMNALTKRGVDGFTETIATWKTQGGGSISQVKLPTFAAAVREMLSRGYTEHARATVQLLEESRRKGLTMLLNRELEQYDEEADTPEGRLKAAWISIAGHQFNC